MRSRPYLRVHKNKMFSLVIDKNDPAKLSRRGMGTAVEEQEHNETWKTVSDVSTPLLSYHRSSMNGPDPDCLKLRQTQQERTIN